MSKLSSLAAFARKSKFSQPQSKYKKKYNYIDAADLPITNNCSYICNNNNECKRLPLYDGLFCFEHDKKLISVILSVIDVIPVEINEATDEELQDMGKYFIDNRGLKQSGWIYWLVNIPQINSLSKSREIPDSIKSIYSSYNYIEHKNVNYIETMPDLYNTVIGVYKIHLQPLQEYQLFVLERLFLMMRESKTFRYNIDMIKAILSYETVLDLNKIPSIVIYPLWGKEIAKFILKVVYELFKDCSDQIGLNITPRYNHKINNLIYIAGYDGSTKKYLEINNKPLLDKLFIEPEYAFFKCDPIGSCSISKHDIINYQLR